VSLLHRFGSARNEHLHCQCVAIKSVFDARPDATEVVQFPEALVTDADIQRVQTRVRQRVFRWFAAQCYLDPDDAKDVMQWDNGGGLSLDASFGIEADDRSGLVRLLRYWSRPAFAPGAPGCRRCDAGRGGRTRAVRLHPRAIMQIVETTGLLDVVDQDGSVPPPGPGSPDPCRTSNVRFLPR
jgi:hypothetical protein